MKLSLGNKIDTEKNGTSRTKLAKKISLRAKVTISAIIVGILPVLVVGGVVYKLTGDYAIEKSTGAKLSEVQEIADNLQGFLAERTANMDTLVRFTKSEFDLNSQSDLNSAITDKKQEFKAVLNKFTEEYDDISSITLYDLKGRQLVNSSALLGENNPSQSDYFRAVIERRDVVIGDPNVTKIGGKEGLAVYVATPIKDNSGNLLAILVAKIPVETIGDAILKDPAASKQGTIYNLVDGSGKVFQAFNQKIDPEGRTIGTKLPEKLPSLTKIIDSHQARTWVETPAQGSNDNRFINSYAPLNRFKGLNWGVVTSLDKNAILGSQQQLMEAIAWVSLLTAATTAMVASLLANRSIRPILQAIEVVEKIGKGDLESRLPIRGNDELAVLGTNINRMAGDIQNLIQQQQTYSDKLFAQNDVLNTLTRNDSLLAGDVFGTARAFTEAIAQTLQTSRVSIWLFSERRDAINCIDLYEIAENKHDRAQSLKFDDYYGYFQALLKARPLAEEDAQTSLTMQKLKDDYLAPAGILSKLDIPIQSGGMVAGVICCEQVDQRRLWQAEEVLFVGSVANPIALAIESEQLQKDIINLLNTVSEVEDGNLTIRALVSDRTTGLVADTFNRLLEQLGGIMAQVVQTSNRVSYTSSDLGELTETVASNAQEQAKEATSVLKLSKQVKVQVENSVEQIDTANKALKKVNSAVESGQDALRQMNQGIDILRDGTNQIVQQMKTLGEFVGLADQFVQEQGQIASLTQVLALNATLVAARASEQKDPMQFAVVAREFEAIASEVSTLAQQTNDGLATLQQRTEQINNVVSYVDGQVQNLGGLVNGFTVGVERSNQIYDNVSRVTKEVIRASETVALYNRSIVNASQSTTKAMKEIVTLAARNAKLTQKVRVESTVMEKLSNNLLDKVSFFRVGDISLSETIDFDEDLPDLIPLDELSDDSEHQTLVFVE
jgi:methyl-accepting chemotaxis protein PixJ